MSGWKNWFNIKFVKEKDGMIGGLAVRLFGIDSTACVVLDPRQWVLVNLQIFNVPTRSLLLAECGPALFYIGRSDYLWLTSPE